MIVELAPKTVQHSSSSSNNSSTSNNSSSCSNNISLPSIVVVVVVVTLCYLVNWSVHNFGITNSEILLHKSHDNVETNNFTSFLN